MELSFQCRQMKAAADKKETQMKKSSERQRQKQLTRRNMKIKAFLKTLTWTQTLRKSCQDLKTGLLTPGRLYEKVQRFYHSLNCRQGRFISLMLYDFCCMTVRHGPCSSEQWIQAFEMKCFRRLLQVSYREQKRNVTWMIGPKEPVLAMVKWQKLMWFSHYIRHDTLLTTVLQWYVEGGQCRGNQKKSWVTTTNFICPFLGTKIVKTHHFLW